MIRTFLTILLVAWAALAVPSICQAGMLEHECACGLASDCTHEESCGSDPCSVANPSTAAKFALGDLSLQSLAPISCRLPAVLMPDLDGSWIRANHELAIAPPLHPGTRPLRN